MGNEPRLTPPGLEQPEHTEKRLGSEIWLVAALFGLVLVGLAVIIFLPKVFSPQQPDSIAPPTKPTATGITPPAPATDTRTEVTDGARVDSHRQQAESLLAKVLQRLAVLESDKVSIWGGKDYLSVIEDVETGDAAVDQGLFIQASKAYQQALRGLSQLDNSREQRFTDALANGAEALRNNNTDAARLQFRIALALEPENAEAAQGLKRAETLDQVTALVDAGEALESQQQWDAALESFAAAVALDALHAPAQEGLKRAQSHIKARAFQVAMSSLLRALDSGDFGKAEQALTQARELDPQAPEIAEVTRQLAAARKTARLNSLRRRARAAQDREDWRTASDLFRQALALDRSATFARTGLQRAETRIGLEKKINRYVQQPERLQSTQVLNNAKKLLEVTNAIQDTGPKLKAQRAELERILTEAQTPVPIRIFSDNATRVVIYHIGRLGVFDFKELTLRPGTYTVVGTRDGYRDVRKVFTLKPDSTPLELDVRCEELI